MTCVIVDYDSGNLHSAEKSFQRMAREVGGDVKVSADPADLWRASRIVLPGVGAFHDCKKGLEARPGLLEALLRRVETGVPFLGICVGMQLMATSGDEHGIHTLGFGWIDGHVTKLAPGGDLKIPHMGWNALEIDQPHPVLEGIASGDHAYFVHSYHMATESLATRLAHVDYGQKVTAMVGKGNMVGVQFHPEKSQQTGLKLIGNFLRWTP
ncbi:imidazole glycerol phosphate synthase subunit HisH [Paracoccaceae bacterium GXU_MW_L88]